MTDRTTADAFLHAPDPSESPARGIRTRVLAKRQITPTPAATTSDPVGVTPDSKDIDETPATDPADDAPVTPVTPRPTSFKPRDQTPEWVIASKPRKFGPRVLLWHIYRVFHLYNLEWIPVPRACGLYGRRRVENCTWLWDNRLLIKAIVMVFAEKGGSGKTTISTWVAAFMRVTTEFLTILLDCDSGGGHAAERFGIDKSTTLTTGQLVWLVTTGKWIPTPDELTRLIAQDPATGMLVTYMVKKTDVSAQAMRQALHALSPAVGSIYVDCSPGFKENNTEGVALAATVFSLPGCLHVKADMTSIESTLDEGAYLRDKMATDNNVIIEISAVPWMQYNLRTVYKLAARFDVDPSTIVLIPKNRWLKNTEPVSYNRGTQMFEHIGLKTSYALSELTRRHGEAAKRYNERHPRPLVTVPAALGAPQPRVEQIAQLAQASKEEL